MSFKRSKGIFLSTKIEMCDMIVISGNPGMTFFIGKVNHMNDEIVEAVRKGLYRNGCEIEFLNRETEEIMSVFSNSTEALVSKKVGEMLPEIKEKAHIDAVKQVRAEFSLAEGFRIYGLSSFISETIRINGEELFPNSFIPDRPVYAPISEDNPLYFNDEPGEWRLFVKNGKTKLISRFVVTACLIVNASGPGTCHAFVVFLKGQSKPLIFWEGVIEAAELRRQTQFHQRGLSYGRKDLYYDSFLRALKMCKVVYFLTLPRHAGWNITPDGLRVFVDSAMMQPHFLGLFLNSDSEKNNKKGQKMHNIFLDVSLQRTNQNFDDVAADYQDRLPDALHIKVGTVISAMSRLLPHYKAEGLVQDRLWVVETADDTTATVMTAFIQNRNHRAAKALFSSEQIKFIKDEIRKYVDCAAVLRHSCAICSMHDFNKILKYLYELMQNGYAENENGRLVPVLLIDNAGIIPEEFQIHQLSISDTLRIDNIEQAQRILGELDYHLVKYAEHNPDSMAQRLKVAITEAKEKVAVLPRRSQSSSAVMFIATALLLKEGGILTETDVQAMLKWISTEAKERTSMSRSVCKIVGDTLSDLICNGSLPIAKQYGPPFWTADTAFVAGDDSINITKDTLDDEILTDLSVGRNTALQYLKDEDALFTNKGEDQKTWTVETEDGKRKPRRFYSFSRDLLTPEADKIVDESIASDLFHKPDEPIDNFFPFIKHRRLDMVAGQIITDYKHGTPSIAVTGAPGSGKTDWIMRQTVQRAKAGDVVVVLDPTNAFSKDELLGHEIPEEIIDNYFTFWDMSTQGWPINILDCSECENTEQQLQKITSLFISGMHLTGVNQKAILKTQLLFWLNAQKSNFETRLRTVTNYFLDNAEQEKLRKRLDALLSTVRINRGEPSNWKEILNKRGKVIVISCGNAAANCEVNPFDVILDTLYSYKDQNRDNSVTVVLDEFQTLNRYKGCTLEAILSRGRKLNMSVILASQDYTDKKDSIGRFYAYCGTHILFRPLGEECIRAVAELTKLDISIIRTLPDFCCAIMGSIYSKYNKKNTQLSSAVMGETYRPSYSDDHDTKSTDINLAHSIPHIASQLKNHYRIKRRRFNFR